MQRITPSGARFRPKHTIVSQRTVCVVDPRPEDYQSWRATADERGLQLKFVASAEAALRLAHGGQVDLWMVNSELPGLSGFELCSMLKAQADRATVYLVTNEYSTETEQAAWRARATLFGCKPMHEAWLTQWLDSRSRRFQSRSGADPTTALAESI